VHCAPIHEPARIGSSGLCCPKFWWTAGAACSLRSEPASKRHPSALTRRGHALELRLKKKEKSLRRDAGQHEGCWGDGDDWSGNGHPREQHACAKRGEGRYGSRAWCGPGLGIPASLETWTEDDDDGDGGSYGRRYDPRVGPRYSHMLPTRRWCIRNMVSIRNSAAIVPMLPKRREEQKVSVATCYDPR
jgi:hypothetical protein